MALTQNSICDFGWKARDFALEGIDGKTYSLADVRGPKGVLVVFITVFVLRRSPTVGTRCSGESCRYHRFVAARN